MSSKKPISNYAGIPKEIASGDDILTGQGVVFPEVASPGSPAANTVILYAKADGKLYKKDDGGAEVEVGAGTGGGYTIIGVNSTPYTIIPITGHIIYLVDTSGGNVTMNVPTAVGNTAMYTIKKVTSDANKVIINPNGTELLDGYDDYEILFYRTAITIVSDGANLRLV